MTPILWILTSLLPAAEQAPAMPWPQWGGPNRDFTVDSPPLADRFAEGGPSVLWSRPFGEGYSTIVCDGPRLFTLRRDASTDEEVVAAIDRESGDGLWSFAYPAPLEDDMDVEFGPGPHSTPLLVGDLVITVGVTVKIHALERDSGAVRWSRDLRKDYGATHLKRGYCASPLLLDGQVVLPIAGEGQAVLALDVETGEETWKGHTFLWAYASPFRIDWADGPELILFWNDAIGGLDPATRALRWRVEHKNSWQVNVAMPIWLPGDSTGILVASSAYGLGSQGIRLSRADGETDAEVLWHQSKLQIHHGNAVRVGDIVYGSSGRGPAIFTAVDLRTGEVAWRDRTIGKSTILVADGKLIVLDEEGELFLVRPSRDELVVLARASVLERVAWSAPTLVGATLYLRDRKTLLAVDLSPEGSDG